MRPYMMTFQNGKGVHERRIFVNMNQVCYIATDGADGSVLLFNAVIENEPSYLCVNEPPESIIARMA